MVGKKRKIALIPAYEPDNKLIDVVGDLKKNDFEIVVVNDGSGREYQDIFDKVSLDAKVISYDVNKGKGYALKTGLKYIRDNYNDYVVVTMDCDGQHTVKDAVKLCCECLNDENILVLGKRIRSSKTPFRSRLGNSITRIIYKITTKLDVYDTQTGLRAFSDVLMGFLIGISGDRYEYEMNVLLECANNDIKIREVEIETIYIDNNSNSHFNAIKDSILVYKNIIKFSCPSLFSFVVDYLFYVLFVIIFHNVIGSNVLARIISSIVNFSINKRFVFNSDKAIYKSAYEYFLLASFVLIFNTCFLKLIIYYVDINILFAKIITEMVMFIFSYLIQK